MAVANPYGGAQGNWTTVNGQRTVPQMASELSIAGYNGPTDPGSILAAYGRTTGGSVGAAAGQPGAYAGTLGSPTARATNTSPLAANGNLGDIQNRMLAALAAGNKAAFDEAVREYDLSHGLDVQKYQASVDQFNKSFGLTQAGLTGTYNGASTLAAQRQQADIAAQTAGITGVYNAPGGGANMPTAADFARQDANTQAIYNQYHGANAAADWARDAGAAVQAAGGGGGAGVGVPTLAAQQQQQTAANQYLQLISSLRGPNDPAQYIRTLQGTPRGLADVVNAAAGRYSLGGVASGEQAAPATVGGQLANMNGAGAMAQQNPLDPLARALPAANQIDNRAYNQMLPSQRAGLWSIYEYGGPSGAMRPEDAQAMLAQGLPRYAGPTTGGINLKV